jgi:FkbM family methyltransferase
MMELTWLLFLILLISSSESCKYAGKTERSFSAVLYSLFQDKTVPLGDVLDVGAHNGVFSCMYACFDQNRTVHAVDPSPKLVSRMHCEYPNMKKHNYAVSNATGWMNFVGTTGGFVGKLNHQSKGEVEIQTLDNLFLEKWNTYPGFLHIDVEGYELQVLQGATKVISKHQPIFTVEAHVLEDVKFTNDLIAFAESLGYGVYMVNEICGMRKDCRNFICFPDGIRKNIHNNVHPMLDVAIRSGTMIHVTASNVFERFGKYEATALPWFEDEIFH